MTARKNKVGDTVLVRVDPRLNNGADEAPALITRVWDNGRLNVRVLYDGPDTAWLTSVDFKSKRPKDDDESVGTDTAGVQRVAYPA